MTKRYIFTPPEQLKDAPVIGGYHFHDGQHVRNEFDGPLVEPMLCGYYACKLEVIDDTPEQTIEPDSGSLAKSNTSAAAAQIAQTAQSAQSAQSAVAKPK